MLAPVRVRRARCASIVGLLLAVAVMLTACSNTQSSVNHRPHPGAATASAVGGVQQVTITTGPSDRFDPSTITVHPGGVRIVLINTSGAPHNWTLPGLSGAATATTGGGMQSVVQFIAPAPGRYQFVCTIHEKLGQTGTLVVLPT